MYNPEAVLAQVSSHAVLIVMLDAVRLSTFRTGDQPGVR
jgi:hypothetical protein